MLLGFSGSNAYVLLISLIVAEVTPQVSISQMSNAIEVQLKRIDNQLQRLRRRKQQLLQQQERYFEEVEYRRVWLSDAQRFLAKSLQNARVGDLAQNHKEQQLLLEQRRQLRQLQKQLQEQQQRQTKIFLPSMEQLVQFLQRKQSMEQLVQFLQRKQEEQQQQEQQQRGTKRKLWSESSSSTSSSSDEGSESDGDAPSDNPTAKSAGGDVSNVDLTNAVTRVDALCVDPKNVDLSNGGDASRVDLANAAVPTP